MRKILIILLLPVLLAGCAPAVQNTESTVQQSMPTEQTTAVTTAQTEEMNVNEISRTEPLLCWAESMEEAQLLAELYGITLVAYRNGLATFHTEEDPYEVVRRGKENGWPLLELNHVSTPF